MQKCLTPFFREEALWWIFSYVPSVPLRIRLRLVYIEVDNCSMYINVVNADGFVKVYFETILSTWGGDSYRIPITSSSLLAIVYFPKRFSVLNDEWCLEYDSGLCLM